MKRQNDLIGKRFGYLKVLELSYINKTYHKYFLCLCDCGNKKIISQVNLISGDTVSCTCFQKKLLSKRMTKHGLSCLPIYQVWNDMIRRCYIEKSTCYEYYGGRGIKVCKRWHNINNFYRDMGDRPKNLTIERIDNTGDYESENCCWATRSEQSLNKSNTKKLVVNGVERSIIGWAKINGTNKITIRTRLKRGWTAEKAVVNKNFKYAVNKITYRP